MVEDKKRFWWLKLKEGYFDSEGMRRLRKQAGGEDGRG
nr:MAG TPA: vacuolar protein sorting-associated protein [Caudoviricetes sp.]